MSGQDWPVGTVATATVRGVEGVRVIRCGGVGTSGRDQVPFWWSAEYVIEWRAHDDEDVTDVRPLVVLDLGGAGPVVLANVLRAAAYDSLAEQIAAQTKPPRIPEPGLWGVVEDDEGDRLARTGLTGRNDWVVIHGRDIGCVYDWCDLRPSKVLRPGIEDAS